MDINNRYCVIMCGGVGSRFWPYSRANAPKQFIDFFGTGRTLLQMSFDRTKGVVPAENVIILTNEQYAPLVKEQLPELSDAQILLEPARRNTAPCIAWAAYHIKALNPNALIMVAPSDHLVLKEDQQGIRLHCRKRCTAHSRHQAKPSRNWLRLHSSGSKCYRQHITSKNLYRKTRPRTC